MATPDVRRQIIGFGMIPMESPAPPQLATFKVSEMEKWEDRPALGSLG